MRSRWLPGLLLGLVLVCALVATASARLLPSLLPVGQLRLQGLAGTLWHGRASRAALATPAGTLELGRVEWRLSPWSLLLLAPSVTLDSAWGAQQLRGVVRVRGPADLDVRDLDGRVDAALLQHFIPVRLGGSFALQFAELDLRDGEPVRATGRLVWDGASWASTEGLRPLETYAADIATAADGAISGTVVTLAGAVTAEGGVSWQAPGYNVNIALGGPGLADPQLRQALLLMAAPEGEGFRIALQGRLQR